MYRIELAPGEVTVFRTIEELATGVRNGVITPRARIFHAATDKWLPIEFHPHYKRVMETPPGKPVGVPAPGAAAMPTPTRPEPEAEAVHAPAPAPVPTPPPAPGPAPVATASPVLQLPRISYPEPVPAEALSPEPAAKAGSAPRRPLHLALLAVVLAAGGYVVVSAFSPAPADESPAVAPAVARPEMPRTDTVRTDSMSARPAPAATPRPAAEHPAPRPLPPASSGFAPALEARAIASGPMPVRDSAPPPAPVLAPAPAADLGSAPAADLALPELGTDSMSLVARQRDSTQLRQILRAVSSPEAAGR